MVASNCKLSENGALKDDAESRRCRYVDMNDEDSEDGEEVAVEGIPEKDSD